MLALLIEHVAGRILNPTPKPKRKKKLILSNLKIEWWRRNSNITKVDSL